MQPLGVSRKDAAFAPADVLPLFACPGAKEVAIEHAVFPHGSGFSEMMACPARATCAWYASHDFGGDFAFNEQPQERLLSAEFEEQPFHCTNFQALPQTSGRTTGCARRCRSQKRCGRE